MEEEVESEEEIKEDEETEKIEITIGEKVEEEDMLKEIEKKAHMSGQLLGRKLKEFLRATRKTSDELKNGGAEKKMKETGTAFGKGVKLTKDMVKNFKEGFQEGLKE